MDDAGIRYPRRFKSSREIDRLVMVKAPHKKVSFERAFFLVRSPQEYEREVERLAAAEILDPAALEKRSSRNICSAQPST